LQAKEAACEFWENDFEIIGLSPNFSIWKAGKAPSHIFIEQGVHQIGKVRIYDPEQFFFDGVKPSHPQPL